MNLNTRFPGFQSPFEGERTLSLRTLPEGAQITSARLVITPRPYKTTVRFNGDIGDWGATRESGSEPTPWTTVDLHTQRKIIAFVARAVDLSVNVRLQVDMGGLWVQIGDDGNVHAGEGPSTGFDLERNPQSFQLPPLLARRFKLQFISETNQTPPPNIPDIAIDNISIISNPSNLTVSLGDGPPIWARAGELTQVERSPDLTTPLQDFLTTAQVKNGNYVVPLVVHSDTIATFDLAVEIDFTVAQSVLPAGVRETVLPFKHDGIAITQDNLLSVQLPVGARVVPGQTTGRVIGSFDPSRIVHGPTGSVTPDGAVPVEAGLSQAQPILLEEDTAATAIDLLLQADSRSAELDLLLLQDTDGQPGLTPLLAEPRSFTIDRDIAAQPTWISVALDQEFQFKKGTRVWLVVQARSGKTCWSITAGEGMGVYQTDNGGLSWRPTAVPVVNLPLAAFFRLRHVPPRFQMPIEVEIGSGEAAERVFLDRFAPMGRVDFHLNFDEFTQKINAFLENEPSPICPEGEHLANGAFDRWTTLGDNVGQPRPIDMDGTPLTIAYAVDDQHIYIGGLNRFRILDGSCSREFDSFALQSGQSLDIAVHPNGKYVFLLTGIFGEDSSRSLLVIDTATRRPVGATIELDDDVNGIAISPDGRDLAIFGNTSTRGRIQAIPVDTILNNPSSIGSEAIPSLNLAPDNFISDAKYTEDNAQLVLSVRQQNADQGALVLLNSNLDFREVISIDGCRFPEALSLISGTNRAVVCERGPYQLGNVFIVDYRQGETVVVTDGSPYSPFVAPVGVVTTPNGQRAFVIDQNPDNVFVIDLLSAQLTHSFSLQTDPSDIAINFEGDIVSVPVTNFEGFTFLVQIQLGNPMPEEWTLTSGLLSYECLSDPYKRVAILGFSTHTQDFSLATSSLSQVVPVTPECPYDFSFWGIATNRSAIAEIIWRGDGCTADRVDQIEFALFEEPEETDGDGEESELELILHRLRAIAPTGATQAEIRFTTPPNEGAAIDLVSFKGSLEGLENSDFQLRPDNQLAGWTLSPAAAASPTIDDSGAGVLINNGNPTEIVLAQILAVTGGNPYILTFSGQVEAASGNSHPQIELQWRTKNGEPAGTPAVLSLDPAGPDQQGQNGMVPEEATEAQLRLIFPGNSAVRIVHISFRPVELVEIPINFIAQAPGELSITDFNVAYEMVSTEAVSPLPADGLCQPTSSGDDDCCHCPCCGGNHPLSNPEPTQTRAGRPAIEGRCTNCGTSLLIPGGRLERQPERIVNARPVGRRVARPVPRRVEGTLAETRGGAVEPPTILPVEAALEPLLTLSAAGWAELAGTSGELDLPPLTEVHHVGPARASELAKIGFPTIDRLAACGPTVLAAGMRGISIDKADEIINSARDLLTIAERRQAPLVSCIMPTFNRPHFIPQALHYFNRQTYPHLELIIVDDGIEPVESLIPRDDRIRYIHTGERLTIGAKMNIGCDAATGDWLIRWEDDVWMAEWRVAYQMAAMLTHRAEICGPDHYLHYSLLSDQAWISRRPGDRRPWILGSTLAFARSYWNKSPFPNISLGDEIEFARRGQNVQVVTNRSTAFSIDIIHGGNTAPKDTRSNLWHPYPLGEIEALMGEDIEFYRQLAAENDVDLNGASRS
ncbi:MAG: glycosyltransferase [Ardenticatenaceae bacterium]|nr:glycosyltransferase [Ardenticatenaceae bacterium]